MDWIKYKDKKPTEHGCFLLAIDTRNKKNRYCVLPAWYSPIAKKIGEHTWTWPNSNFRLLLSGWKIIAWQPLPEYPNRNTGIIQKESIKFFRKKDTNKELAKWFFNETNYMQRMAFTGDTEMMGKVTEFIIKLQTESSEVVEDKPERWNCD